MNPRLRIALSNGVGLLVAVAFWCLLWGEVSAKSLLGGLAVALLVRAVFPMPPMGHELMLRPWPFVVFVVRFAADVVISALQVAWYAIRPAPQPPGSVIAVQMRSRSDLFLTLTAVLSTLIPGSVVVEAQRSTGTLFLHVIGAGTLEEVEEARRRVHEQELRALRALASRTVLEEAGLVGPRRSDTASDHSTGPDSTSPDPTSPDSRAKGAERR